MVRIPHLLVGTFLLRLASARVSRSQAARRVSIPLNHGDDELAEFGTALKVKKRNGSPESGAGFCRKRAVVVENAGAPITLASGSQQVPPSTTFACNPEDADCLPTNTIATATSTSYIDVTSTIYVTAAPAITSQYTTAQPSIPSPSVPSESDDPAPPSSSGGNCPSGYSWKRVADDFATFNSDRWKRESGTEDQVAFGPNGLIMKLTEQSPNIVFESTSKWTSPVSLTASIKTTQAGGIVNCAIFGQSGTDEIDLELIEGTWQVPIWNNGKRLEKNQDVTWTLADTSREIASWVFEDRNVKPYSAVHDWTLHWGNDALGWSVDGKKLLDVKRLEGGAWPEQALPFRWGPWAASGGWAGQLDWGATPEPVMQLRQVVIEGCQLDL